MKIFLAYLIPIYVIAVVFGLITGVGGDWHIAFVAPIALFNLIPLGWFFLGVFFAGCVIIEAVQQRRNPPAPRPARRTLVQMWTEWDGTIPGFGVGKVEEPAITEVGSQRKAPPDAPRR